MFLVGILPSVQWYVLTSGITETHKVCGLLTRMMEVTSRLAMVEWFPFVSEWQLKVTLIHGLYIPYNA
jgi:hypothetical protein